MFRSSSGVRRGGRLAALVAGTTLAAAGVVALTVSSALAAATGGVRLRRLPMTPERVWRAVSEVVAPARAG